MINLKLVATSPRWRSVQSADGNYSEETVRAYKGETPLYGLWRNELSGTDPKGWKLDSDLQLRSVKGAQNFLERLHSQDWFQNSFDTSKWQGPITVARLKDYKPDAKPISTATTSHDKSGHPYIFLSEPLAHSASKLVLLHESAHATDVPISHGPSFRGNYIHIIHHAIGEHGSKALMMGYRQQGLDWNFDSLKPDAAIDSLRYTEKP